MKERKDIKSFTLSELETDFSFIGEKPFRASQVFQWLHEKKVTSFDEMTNLSKELREKCKQIYFIPVLEPIEVKTSSIDKTQKYLFRLPDGNIIESVWMSYRYGSSVCISSQAGCRMGCRFCASTLNGLERSLTPSEMLEQIDRISQLRKERISHVVIMGTGEPLDNYENVLKFLRLVSDKSSDPISQRNITLSTCGLVPEIRKLAKERLQITLAISLHAPNDEIRRKLMPIAKRYSIEEVLLACDDYFEKTKRRISFEYSLIQGVNDSEENAVELAKRISHRGKQSGEGNGYCHVNLIPVNPIKERNFKQTQKAEISKFKKVLEKYGINVTIRREMGRDIQGACGQLRKGYQDRQKKTKEGKGCRHME